MARASQYQEHRVKVLELVEDAVRHHSKPPSVRDLAEDLDVGVATMHSYLNKLREEGMVTWQPKHHRSLRVTQQGSQVVLAPAGP